MFCWRRAQWALAAITLAILSASVVRPSRAADTAAPNGGAEIRVGIGEGDLRGDDHRALQAAVGVASSGRRTRTIGFPWRRMS